VVYRLDDLSVELLQVVLQDLLSLLDVQVDFLFDVLDFLADQFLLSTFDHVCHELSQMPFYFSRTFDEIVNHVVVDNDFSLVEVRVDCIAATDLCEELDAA
jgi:hypothetical protein